MVQTGRRRTASRCLPNEERDDRSRWPGAPPSGARGGEPRRRPATLLLIDPDNPGRLAAQRNRWWTRLVARLMASRLDHQLARGRSPEESSRLAARAQVLVSSPTRLTLARGWTNIVVRARRPPTLRDPRVALNRDAIVASEPEIHELVAALLAPAPIAVRGCALASRLLSDGAGPLYDRHRAADVTGAVRETAAQLDPGVRF